MPKMNLWTIVLVSVAILAAAASLFLLPSPAPITRAAPSEQADKTPAAPRATAPSIDFDQHIVTPGGADPVIPRSVEEVGAPGEADAWDAPAAPWEASINKVLESEAENNNVAADMAALMPSLPLAGQIEAVQHMVNLVDDEQYGLVTRVLLNPSLHPDLREIILADLLDRPAAVKFPALLVLLGTSGHPLRNEARNSLRDAVGMDLGENPASWNAAVQELTAKEEAGVADPDVFPGAFNDAQQP